jgi:hypothetical protein
MFQIDKFRGESTSHKFRGDLTSQKQGLIWKLTHSIRGFVWWSRVVHWSERGSLIFCPFGDVCRQRKASDHLQHVCGTCLQGTPRPQPLGTREGTSELSGAVARPWLAAGGSERNSIVPRRTVWLEQGPQSQLLESWAVALQVGLGDQEVAALQDRAGLLAGDPPRAEPGVARPDRSEVTV